MRIGLREILQDPPEMMRLNPSFPTAFPVNQSI